ncbi:MAG: hypothetical protein AAF718_16255 [Pseudomonadota bacterium]
MLILLFTASFSVIARTMIMPLGQKITSPFFNRFYLHSQKAMNVSGDQKERQSFGCSSKATMGFTTLLAVYPNSRMPTKIVALGSMASRFTLRDAHFSARRKGGALLSTSLGSFSLTNQISKRFNYDFLRLRSYVQGLAHQSWAALFLQGFLTGDVNA